MSNCCRGRKLALAASANAQLHFSNCTPENHAIVKPPPVWYPCPHGFDFKRKQLGEMFFSEAQSCSEDLRMGGCISLFQSQHQPFWAKELNPFFSIIIPVYNVAHAPLRALRVAYGNVPCGTSSFGAFYLSEYRDSVLAQTFTDREAICVDDGSTDGSGAILDGYATKEAA